MAIVTVSRETAALGDETAHELAKQLNYRLVDKYALEEHIKSYGITSRKFEKYDEKKPSFLASLSHGRDDYLHFLKSAILSEAGQGNAVFIGRGVGAILKRVPGVFSIFLASQPEISIERVKKSFNCDEKQARQIIEHSDRDREGFHQYFFDLSWKDVDNYHLALNTGYLQPEHCAGVVKSMLNSVITKDIEGKCLERIRELTMEQQIKHQILYEKSITIHFLEVSVTGNQVILYGVTNNQSTIDEVLSIVKELAPEASIQSEIQVVLEYGIYS